MARDPCISYVLQDKRGQGSPSFSFQGLCSRMLCSSVVATQSQEGRGVLGNLYVSCCLQEIGLPLTVSLTSEKVKRKNAVTLPPTHTQGQFYFHTLQASKVSSWHTSHQHPVPTDQTYDHVHTIIRRTVTPSLIVSLFSPVLHQLESSQSCVV